MKLTMKPITENFGMEVMNVDLAEVDAPLADSLLDAISEHGVLLFRRQSLHDEDLHKLSVAFGKPEIPASKKSHSPGFHEVIYISNMADVEGNPICAPISNDEGVWHSDQAFRAHPATLSTLFCVASPETGGSTSFCSTNMGYEALPETLKVEIGKLRGRYLPAPVHEVEKIEVSHPAVLESPSTGRKTLYVSPTTRGFDGMAEAEGKALVNDLLAYQMKQEHQYTHAWRMGDMLIYDNAQFLHRRDSFNGLRWLKASRVFLSPERFAVPD